MYEVAQTFTPNFKFYRIDIEVKSKSCYKPSNAVIELYDSNNFQEKPFNDKFYIEMKTPIARTTVLVPPAMESAWVTLVFKQQEPGNYCWLLRNLYDADPSCAYYVRRKVPKLYTGGYSYFNRWRDTESDYSSVIYASPAVIERHLISKGTTESMSVYEITADAPDTNPIIVEGKGLISHVSNVVRDSSGRAVGIIISGSEIFEQGEVAVKTVTFYVHTPEKYPVYNAAIMQDGTEIGRTDKDGRLVTMVELAKHTYTGKKVLSKEIDNLSAVDISKMPEIKME
jgi:hypothetical protein